VFVLFAAFAMLFVPHTAAQEQGRGAPQGFPAQQRPPGDPAVVARGKTQYELICAACHGRDLRGGDLGGPNLLRSLLVLGDQHGEAIGPVIKNGYSSGVTFTHSSLVKTVEEIFGLPILPTVASANDFGDLFKPGALP